jgi:1,4-alpha-glucan branching enzyme
VSAPPGGAWTELFNSDAERYGGSGLLNREHIETEPKPFGGRGDSFVITLPPLGGVILRRQA